MITKEKLFDPSFLEDMDDKDFIKEVIALYLKDTNIDLAQMKRSFDDADFEAIYKMAHKLKSSTGMLQANTLYAVLENTEQVARSRQDSDKLARLIESAGLEFEELKGSLELYLHELSLAS